MDKNSSSKVISTTPFSINDILTRNNTSIFRRIPDGLSVSRRSVDHTDFEADVSEKLRLHPHDAYATGFQKYRMSESPSDSRSESEELAEKQMLATKGHFRHSPGFYYVNNNNNEHLVSGSYQRRRSLDCFLTEGDSLKDKRASEECYDGKSDNTGQKNEYYGVPGGETPLDMRRCASNDSGEWHV